MKKKMSVIAFILAGCLLYSASLSAQNPVNWTSQEIMAPAELARILQTNENLPVIISIGPGAVIPHSIAIGMINDKKNMARFKEELNKLPKSTDIVVYCGCCPYEHCPNVRPAMALLQKMNFTRYHLLDLSTNIKTDWIDRGYPVNQ